MVVVYSEYSKCVSYDAGLQNVQMSNITSIKYIDGFESVP